MVWNAVYVSSILLACLPPVFPFWTENITLENCLRKQNGKGSIHTACHWRLCAFQPRRLRLPVTWKQTGSCVAAFKASFDDGGDCCAFQVHLLWPVETTKEAQQNAVPGTNKWQWNGNQRVFTRPNRRTWWDEEKLSDTVLPLKDLQHKPEY